MSRPADYQDKRYDNRARRLYAAAQDTATVGDETVTLSLAAWQALGAGLERPLMIGDLTRFAEEKPAAVFEAARRLAASSEWMARARAGEGR